MKIFKTRSAFSEWRRAVAPETQLAFVPTMGALHEGHMALVAAGKRMAEVVVASIFVNPTQFDQAADLAAYPLSPEQDIAQLAAQGCDALFLPQDAAELYPQGTAQLQIVLPGIADRWEGASRPGHFSGVALVVSKFLQIVQPHYLVMGEKDYQQTRVVNRLLHELFFPTQLCVLPTVREADGLARSSRNRRLGPAGRAHAPRLYAILQEIAAGWQQGSSAGQLLANGKQAATQIPGAELDYLALADTQTLGPLPEAATQDTHPQAVVLIACYLDKVRLIDCLPLG